MYRFLNVEIISLRINENLFECLLSMEHQKLGKNIYFLRYFVYKNYENWWLSKADEFTF